MLLTERANEQELLKLCAHGNRGAADRVRFAALVNDNTDWPYVVNWAGVHRILPQLYLTVKSACAETAPPQILRDLHEAYFLNAAHNLRLAGELIRLIELFDHHGIDTVPFKGPLLAESVYGTVSMRQFGDLDILVKRDDVSHARQLLIDEGYSPEFNLKGKIESEYLRSEHAFQLQKDDLVVELHWRLGSRDQVFPVIVSDIWPRLRRQSFQGRVLRTMAPEDLLLYLCMHGAKHGWDRLEWISCLREMLEAERELDWAELVQRARRSGALRGLHLGILLAESLGEVTIPVDLRRDVYADQAALSLAREVLDNLFVEKDHSRREVERHSLYLRSRERVLDQIRIVLFSCSRVPHPLAKDWTLFRIPVSMSFLYYVLRPIRLLREYGFRRLRALFRQTPTFHEGKYL